MVASIPVQHVLTRYSSEIQQAIQQLVPDIISANSGSMDVDLKCLYGQIGYHLGWIDTQFSPQPQNTGKLLRPTLLLLAYEAVGAWGQTTASREKTHLHRALPAAAAIELLHNFTLMHDDIEDGDTERRHRPTVWALWGVPLAINAGDGLHCLSHLALWSLLEAGVEPSLITYLGKGFDSACLALVEGQHLDLSFENHLMIDISRYIEMITRKTAVLIEYSVEAGALLGTRQPQIIERLRLFGRALGLAFQVRDDILGVWASQAETGKIPAGDIYRRKKSLPILHALQHASQQDQEFLQNIYRYNRSLEPQQVARVLEILARTHSREYCQQTLLTYCHQARETLTTFPRVHTLSAQEALIDLETLVHFVEEEAHNDY